MEAKKDNVLQFPGTKKTEATNTSGPPEVPKAAPQIRGRKKASAIVGLSVLMLGSWFANNFSSNSTDMASTGGRQIASVGSFERDSDWEKSLAKDLSKRSRRELASVQMGKRPSLEDRLSFSALKSQYAIIMTEGKLSEVHWSESASEMPVYLKDKPGFLLEYRDLMPVEFEAAVKLGRDEGNNNINETFALMNDDIKVAEVRFDLDGYGRLKSLVVTPSTSGQ